jgi:hypothetical protein
MKRVVKVNRANPVFKKRERCIRTDPCRAADLLEMTGVVEVILTSRSLKLVS